MRAHAFWSFCQGLVPQTEIGETSDKEGRKKKTKAQCRAKGSRLGQEVSGSGSSCEVSLGEQVHGEGLETRRSEPQFQLLISS